MRQAAKKMIMENPAMQTKAIAEVLGCSRRTVRRARQEMGSEGVKWSRLPRILIFDIETSPMEVYVWGLYKQRISPDNVIKDWAILSWAAKWLFEPKIMSSVVTPEEAIERKDGSIIKGIWDLFEEADFVVAHNGLSFDVRKLNMRFLLNKLSPPLPYNVVDTLKVSRRYFAASSNKLDYLNRILENPRKIETKFELWERCVTGDAEALKEMERYNKGDVTALEELYATVRPWIKSHPNMSLYCEAEGRVCPNCGSENIVWGGSYYTPAGRYSAFRCECGAIGRGRKTQLTKDERKRLTISVAR